jgi:hypothetical protein
MQESVSDILSTSNKLQIEKPWTYSNKIVFLINHGPWGNNKYFIIHIGEIGMLAQVKQN